MKIKDKKKNKKLLQQKKMKIKKKAKPERDTGGFPHAIALVRGGSKEAPIFTVHSMEFDAINRDTVVGIYHFRRVSHVKVMRKIQRTPK